MILACARYKLSHPWIQKRRRVSVSSNLAGI
jgi:hypothetical protein